MLWCREQCLWRDGLSGLGVSTGWLSQCEEHERGGGPQDYSLSDREVWWWEHSWWGRQAGLWGKQWPTLYICSICGLTVCGKVWLCNQMTWFSTLLPQLLTGVPVRLLLYLRHPRFPVLQSGGDTDWQAVCKRWKRQFLPVSGLKASFSSKSRLLLPQRLQVHSKPESPAKRLGTQTSQSREWKNRTGQGHAYCRPIPSEVFVESRYV